TISGLLRPRRGSIRFLGTAIDCLPAHAIAKRGIGHVPEGRRLFPMMTVWENLAIGACTPEAARRFSASLDFIFTLLPRLKDRREQLAGTLSGGEQQMVAIGRALAMCPRLLMMDEPSLGLAPNLVQTIFNTIRSINTQGVTVLLVEQNANIALHTADYGYVLEVGRIVMEDTCARLLEKDDIKEFYLGMKERSVRGTRRWKRKKTWR
ncbi:MAG TPA: ABC transporter ATP-binding protein, partial [Candidatus Sulfotelmatobacter sp.]|nr:ABC transporter ATP-binding protein [Candidatus Sulfotelmatobacter sp.]